MKKRLIKAISYRLTVMTLHMLCLYIYTGKALESLTFSLLFSIVATTIYMIYDKYWVIKRR